MQPRLLRVAESAEAFTSLIEAARQAEVRIGWLELAESSEAVPRLQAASSAGAFRAVVVGGATVVSVKTLKGTPVLRDLVREHFTGCRLLLVLGAVDAPRLDSHDAGWRIRWADGIESVLTSEGLIEKLRKPRFP